ncbi:HEPN domain-containing protein [Saccharomonospora sp.]|uniref:ApeA N-terminal domain 1-containing protein n=1 Tax=Saccharomonospora sp. TaxID=33913 RepID=UPI002612CC43|nr:HEPN domain-containing protein [Saccharomonospora sp.]
MANVIEEGTPRIGYIYDGMKDTPAIPAQLFKRNSRVYLEVPFSPDSPEAAAWFASEPLMFPYAETNHRDLPSALDFLDSSGSIVLIGCHKAGTRHQLMSGIGTGRIAVDYAILGAYDARKYSKINGFRSEIEGLGEWMEIKSTKTSFERDDTKRIKAINIQLKSPPEIKISRVLNLTIRPSFSYGSGDRPDETKVSERMLVETHTQRAREWQEHLSLHIAIRDLVRVSSWRPLGFHAHQATSHKDSVTTIDGSTHGHTWHAVHSIRTLHHSDKRKSGNVDYLFRYSNIGKQGMDRWVRLHKEYSRAIDPLMSLLELRDASIETLVAQLGISLEALGFLVARHDGLSKEKAGRETFAQRLSRVSRDLPSLAPFNIDKWIEDASKAYNAVKHANRDLPDIDFLAQSYWKSLLIARIWIAKHVGASEDLLKKTLEHDRIRLLID